MPSCGRRLLHGGAKYRRMLQLFLFCAISTYLLQGAIFKTLNYLTCRLREDVHQNDVTVPRELIQIQVLFRHGHRSPFSLYKTDPNPAEFWPSGLGTLSQLGKLQHYMVGEYLRKMYAGFLTSNKREVYCLSSSKLRNTYGAYAHLAGMYPPSPDRRIDGQLLWQPVPVEYLEQGDVFQLLETSTTCNKFLKELGTFLISVDGADFIAKSEVLYKFWANKSGEPMTHFEDAGNLFKTLLSEKAYNLIIPKWAQETWEELREQSDICYYFKFKTKLLQGLRAGKFFGIVLEKWRQKIANFENSKKVYLYSSHGSNIASVLLSLNIFNMKSPPYCSFISFELYREQGHRHTIRILYSNTSNPETGVLPPQVMVLPGCTEYCPFEYLEEYLKDLVESNWNEVCESKLDELKKEQLGAISNNATVWLYF